MATRKIRERIKNPDGTYDVIHKETEAGLVKMADGDSLDSKFNVEGKVLQAVSADNAQNLAGSPRTHWVATECVQRTGATDKHILNLTIVGYVFSDGCSVTFRTPAALLPENGNWLLAISGLNYRIVRPASPQPEIIERSDIVPNGVYTVSLSIIPDPQGGGNTRTAFFKSGGTPKPKIFVQSAPPLNPKIGDFWVNASGYTLDTIVVRTNIQTPSKDVLFLMIGSGFTHYRIPPINDYNFLNMPIVYGRAYVSGVWRDWNVSVFNGSSWQDVSYRQSRLYCADFLANKVYELNPDTLSAVKNVTFSTPMGIGGVQGRLYGGIQTGYKIHELHPDTLSSIRSVASPGTKLFGLGGVNNRLYHCDQSGTTSVYELSLDTLSVIKNVPAPFAYPHGIGGTQNRLYVVDGIGDKIYELNPETLSVIKNVSSPGSEPTGIGGTQNRLYHCDKATDKIYELNPDTLSVIKNVSAPSGDLMDIGGTK